MDVTLPPREQVVISETTYVYLRYRRLIIVVLQELTDLKEIELTKPPKKEYGDLSTNVAFLLAKHQRRKPQEIAQELAKKLEERLRPYGIQVSTIGGFINFRLPEDNWINATLSEVLKLKENYGKQNIGRGRKVIVEHTSANPNKPLHLGHFRNACLGDAVARILRFLGFNVEVEYYVNDLGRQVAEAAYGWLYLENEKIPRDKPFDWYLGEVYVKVHNLEPFPEEKIQELMKIAEQGNNEIAKKIKKMAELCLRHHLSLLEKFGIKFNVLIWESDIVKARIFERVTEELISKGYLKRVTEQDTVIKEGKPVPGKEYAGCYILQLSRFGLDDFVYLRSNGVPTYTAKDITFALWKFGKVKGLLFRLFDRYSDGQEIYTSDQERGQEMNFGNGEIVINVIGKEQTYAQQIVKYALKLIGLEKEAENYIHLAYGLVHRKGVKLSGRKGTWKGFTVYEVLDGLKRLVLQRVKDEQLAEKVATSVLRYEMLRYQPKDDIVLDEQRLLDPSQQGGIYVLYAYVRLLHILSKLGSIDESELPENVYAYVSDEPETLELAKLISEFPYRLQLAYKNISPKFLTDYLFELSLLFNSWYTKYSVVKETNKDKKLSRIKLLLALKQIYENTFELLGIQRIDRL
jgi:arginyl-tRNA synthetase